MRSKKLKNETLAAYLQPYFLFKRKIPKLQSGCILTSYNPYGIYIGKRSNQARFRRMAAALAPLSITEVVVGDKSMCYREHSVFVCATVHTARRLMKRFQQQGVYFICNGAVTLLLADGRRLPINGALSSRTGRGRPPRINRANYFSGFDTPQNA